MAGLRNLVKDIVDIILDPTPSSVLEGTAPQGHDLAKRYMPFLQVSSLSGDIVVVFVCQGCRVPMKWEAVASEWQCGLCGSALEVDGAVSLLDHVEDSVRRVKRGVADTKPKKGK